MKVKLDPGAFMPESAYVWDAGYDIRTPVRVVLRPHDSAIIETGIHVEIEHGWVGMLKSKSGLNVNDDIIGEGVIDSEYTGGIKVKLYNLGGRIKIFERGDKVIQLVIVKINKPTLERVEELKQTNRGDNGFGSTGK